MPDNQSQEKISLLRTLGADVRPVPVKPFTDEMNYNHQVMKLTPIVNSKILLWRWNLFENSFGVTTLEGVSLLLFQKLNSVRAKISDKNIFFTKND